MTRVRSGTSRPWGYWWYYWWAEKECETYMSTRSGCHNHSDVGIRMFESVVDHINVISGHSRVEMSEWRNFLKTRGAAAIKVVRNFCRWEFMVNEDDASLEKCHGWVIGSRYEQVQIAQVTNITNHRDHGLHDIWLICTKIDFDGVFHADIRADNRFYWGRKCCRKNATWSWGGELNLNIV